MKFLGTLQKRSVSATLIYDISGKERGIKEGAGSRRTSSTAWLQTFKECGQPLRQEGRANLCKTLPPAASPSRGRHSRDGGRGNSADVSFTNLVFSGSGRLFRVLGVYIYIYIYICIHMYNCMYIYIYIYMYTLTQTNKNIYIYIYIYIYIALYIHVRVLGFRSAAGSRVALCRPRINIGRLTGRSAVTRAVLLRYVLMHCCYAMISLSLYIYIYTHMYIYIYI